MLPAVGPNAVAPPSMMIAGSEGPPQIGFAEPTDEHDSIPFQLRAHRTPTKVRRTSDPEAV